MVSMRWLYLIIYIVGFADEVLDGSVAAMVGEARRLLAGTAPVPVRLGRVFYHPEAVVLGVEPLGALDPVLDAVRVATRSTGRDGHTDPDPWLPHRSVGYSNSRRPS